MKFLSKIVLAVVVNAFALWAASNYVPGFKLTGDIKQILSIAVLLTVLNFVLKPVLKMILGPVIFLTLGLGVLLVNAAILFLLDKLSQNLTIETIPALLYGTLVIGIINFILHLAT